MDVAGRPSVSTPEGRAALPMMNRPHPRLLSECSQTKGRVFRPQWSLLATPHGQAISNILKTLLKPHVAPSAQVLFNFAFRALFHRRRQFHSGHVGTHMNNDDNDWLELLGDGSPWEQGETSIYPLFDQDSQEAGTYFRRNTRDNHFTRRRPPQKFQRHPTQHGLRSQISQWHRSPHGATAE